MAVAMNAILDVAYGDNTAVTACVAFKGWTDSRPSAVHTWPMDGIADYVPGRFFNATGNGSGRFPPS